MGTLVAQLALASADVRRAGVAGPEDKQIEKK